MARNSIQRENRCAVDSADTAHGYTGDYLDIAEVAPGMIGITVGHQCCTQSYTMPVDILTATLSRIWDEQDPRKAELPWSQPLSDALRAKVTK